MDNFRIDKWLYAARFYKARSLAGEEIDKGRVRINDVEAKPAKEVKVGDVVAMRSGPTIRTVTVLGISDCPAVYARAGNTDHPASIFTLLFSYSQAVPQRSQR
jgi:ribosomal 50S subunit-recycling heat shock protein